MSINTFGKRLLTFEVMEEMCTPASCRSGLTTVNLSFDNDNSYSALTYRPVSKSPQCRMQTCCSRVALQRQLTTLTTTTAQRRAPQQQLTNNAHSTFRPTYQSLIAYTFLDCVLTQPDLYMKSSTVPYIYEHIVVRSRNQSNRTKDRCAKAHTQLGRRDESQRRAFDGRE